MSTANIVSEKVTRSTTEVPRTQLYGEIAWLFGRSSLYRNMAVWKLEQWVTPALSLAQFRLYRREGKPVAFLSWAYLSPEVATRYAQDPQSLQPSEWRSGNELWALDLIAPFGDGPLVFRDIRENLFRNQVGRALRPYKNEKRVRVYRFFGKDAVANAHDGLNKMRSTL